MSLIGRYSDRRPACSGQGHVMGCYNAQMDETACVCGKHWYRGNRGVWTARFLYDHAGRGAKLLGYDVYHLRPYKGSREAEESTFEQLCLLAMEETA